MKLPILGTILGGIWGLISYMIDGPSALSMFLALPITITFWIYSLDVLPPIFYFPGLYVGISAVIGALLGFLVGTVIMMFMSKSGGRGR